MPAQQKDKIRTRAQDKAAAARRYAVKRRKCCDDVWKREDAVPFGDTVMALCERCHRCVLRASSFPFQLGHVDEKIPRSLGGDPTDLDNCQLLCHYCHFSGPSGAHRNTERDGLKVGKAS